MEINADPELLGDSTDVLCEAGARRGGPEICDLQPVHRAIRCPGEIGPLRHGPAGIPPDSPLDTTAAWVQSVAFGCVSGSGN